MSSSSAVIDQAPQKTNTEHNKMHERYNLLTALCLIIGTCVGSGIFFKSDNILVATNGNVVLGIAMFTLGCASVIFGGLTLSVFAERYRGTGGMYGYAHTYLSPCFSRFIGWHYTFLYLPFMVAIISWVFGVYACMVFNLPNTLPVQIAIGTIYMLSCAAWNILIPTQSGYFQNSTTIIKTMPLIVVGILGFFFADNTPQIIATHAQAAPAQGLNWIMAAAPIAFALDGWTAALAIQPELKNAKRTLPTAMVLGPLIILALYLAYFVGLTCILGPETVMQKGDESLAFLFVNLLGEKAAILPNIFAMIAVAGTVNGYLMSALRMPMALACNNELPYSQKIASVNQKYAFPLYSAAISVTCCCLAMIIHFVIQYFDLLPNGDFSEIGVAITCLLLPVFYVHVMKMWAHKEVDIFRGLISPILASVTTIILGLSGLSNPTRWPFVFIYIFTFILAIAVTKYHTSKKIPS